jgi:hypothetical protein
MKELKLCDGKYTVVNELNSGGGFYALRYGEKWRTLAGDNLVYAMFQEIEDLRDNLKTAKESLEFITRQYDNTSVNMAKETATKTLDKIDPHRSCPNCHDDCVGWVVEGKPCTGGTS